MSFQNGNNKTALKLKAILDYHLKTLSPGQRGIFGLIVVLLLILSVSGNVATLVVNMKRRVRPLFRACVLSLACSDLVTAILTGVTYLTQFSTEFIQIWHLGDIMCGLIPFFTTAAILVNSMTLVGIAADRYIAVIRAVKGVWEPGTVFSGTCVVLIWGLSAGISSPMISSYRTFDANIIRTNRGNRTVAQEILPVQMCISEKSDNAYYYVIVFAIAFLPSLIAFLWLNGVIAREIWIRRRAMLSYNPPKQTKSTSEQESPKRNGGMGAFSNSPVPFRYKRTTRETRQMRMLCVILLLMVVFLFCRLPTWIYLIMKLYGNYREIVHWILHFSFGAISLASCALNPLLYTFLMGTIQCTLTIRTKIQECCKWRKMCCGGASTTTGEKSHPGNTKEEIYTIFGDK